MTAPPALPILSDLLDAVTRAVDDAAKGRNRADAAARARRAVQSAYGLGQLDARRDPKVGT